MEEVMIGVWDAYERSMVLFLNADGDDLHRLQMTTSLAERGFYLTG